MHDSGINQTLKLSNKANILSFDFGETKIGIAVGNQITKTSHPLKTII